MQFTKISRCMAVLLFSLVAGPSLAAKLGTPQVLMKQNERVSIDIPIELAAGEQLVKVAVAQERVYVALGMSFPQSLRSATVTIQDRQGNPVIHLAGGIPKGDSLPVVLEIDTSSGQAVRQFVAAIAPKAPVAATPRAAVEPVAQKPKTAPVATNAHAAEVVRPIVEAEFDARMVAINDSIVRVAEGIKEITAEFKRDSLEREKQTAALLLLVPPPKQETPWIDDLTMMGGAAILGMSLAAAWFVGSRPKLPVGTSVFLVGAGRTPIEGKFVRVTSASYGKALPYRIADMVTGAPKRIELVWSDDSTDKVLVNGEIVWPDDSNNKKGSAETPDTETVKVLRPFQRRDIDPMQQHNNTIGTRNAV